jgi:serine protease Do
MRQRWVFLLSAALGAAGTADALPLQELLAKASPSVVHLSLRDGKNEEEGSGSGFVVSEDGRIATNHHVVDGATRIVAVFVDGKEVEVVGAWSFDEKDDVAVLQLAQGRYPALRLAPAPARQGDEIAVIGSPLGLGHSITSGIVAAVHEHGTVTRRRKNGEESWQLHITAMIAPGSSGSPILDVNGDVVGLAVGVYSGGGVYFGVPARFLQKQLDRKDAELGSLKPLARTQSGLTWRNNLLISAGFFAVVAITWWWVNRRGRGTRPATGGWRSLGR